MSLNKVANNLVVGYLDTDRVLFVLTTQSPVLTRFIQIALTNIGYGYLFLKQTFVKVINSWQFDTLPLFIICLIY